jgi:hypothetical protein
LDVPDAVDVTEFIGAQVIFVFSTASQEVLEDKGATPVFSCPNRDGMHEFHRHADHRAIEEPTHDDRPLSSETIGNPAPMPWLDKDDERKNRQADGGHPDWQQNARGPVACEEIASREKEKGPRPADQEENRNPCERS